MILGTGIDLVEVERIRSSLTRHGERFLEKILRPEEIRYCRSQRDSALPVAARFAAKEAVAKAFGTGFGEHLGWLDIEITRAPSGAPAVELHGKGLALLEQRGASVIHVSLTHVKDHAAAVAVLER